MQNFRERAFLISNVYIVKSVCKFLNIILMHLLGECFCIK